MNPAIIRLSKRFAPPRINLLQARLDDDYGRTECIEVEVTHQHPEEVTVQELDYYGDVWPFLCPESSLFYLYAVLSAFRDFRAGSRPIPDPVPHLNFDSYFSDLALYWPLTRKLLSTDEIADLRQALCELFEAAPNATDWEELAPLEFLEEA